MLFKGSDVQNLNLTIQRGHRGLFFTEGQPADLGIEFAHEYVVFLYARVKVRVWTTDDISADEYKLVSHQILAMLKGRVEDGEYQSYRR